MSETLKDINTVDVVSADFSADYILVSVGGVVGPKKALLTHGVAFTMVSDAIAFDVKGVSAQTAAFQRYRNNAGTELYTLDKDGNVSLGKLTVGGGSQIAKILTAAATLNFPATPPGQASDLTINLTGVVVGDAVFLGCPTPPTNGTYSAFVSATNTVTVRFLNGDQVSTLNPASSTFKVTVAQ